MPLPPENGERAMDMTKHLRRFLTDDRLRELGGSYTGVIADVAMLQVRNKFIGAKVVEPTIHFADGLLLIPPQKMRRDLIAMHGAETDGWRGLSVRIRRQAIEYRDRKTGEQKIRYEKRAEDPDAAQPVRPAWERSGDFSDTEPPSTLNERADYDDSDESAIFAREREQKS